MKTKHINDMLNKYYNEENTFRKVHVLIDLIEVVVKSHVAFVMATYFRNEQSSDNIRTFVAYELKKPSLGRWRDFASEIITEVAIPNALTIEEYEHHKSKRDYIVNFYVKNDSEPPEFRSFPYTRTSSSLCSYWFFLCQ